MKGITLLGMSAAASALLIFAASEASAQRGGGRGGGVRASSSGSIGSASRGGGANRSTTANRSAASGNRNVNSGNRNVNRSGNVNNINTGDRNVNVNIDNDYDGWGGGYHPVARGAAVAATTAVVMGAYYSSLPSGCVTVVRNGISYSQCGSTWYQPVYSGNNVQYMVVTAP